MNTIQKIVTLALSCLVGTTPLNAQTAAPASSGKPTAIGKSWFEMDEEYPRHRFSIQLDNGESLIITLKKLGHWTPSQDFFNLFEHTDRVMTAYKDSVLQEQHTLCLDVHIPANQKNIITRFTRYEQPGGNLATIDGTELATLKTGIDTLRILQLKAAKTGTHKAESGRIQYTFLLKKLGNYETYAHNEAWKQKTGAMIDSIVAAYSNTTKPDARRHSLNVNYTPENNYLNLSRGSGASPGKLIIDGGFGVSLVRNTLCPNAEYGIGIYLAREEGVNFFTRLSANYFYRFVESSPDNFKVYGTGFVNLELGGENRQKSENNNFFYKVSVGFGYKLTNRREKDRDPSMSKDMYRLFFNYAINKFFVFTPELISNFGKGDRYNGWLGISLGFRLF